jgi:hypothetical protein
MQAGAHVAKLFANGVQEEQEPMYKALTQCLGGMSDRLEVDWPVCLDLS